MSREQTQIPWYKNYILILAISIPLLTVAGSMFTIYLAISSKDSAVIETYQKQGLTPGKRSVYPNEIAITGDISNGALTLTTDPAIEEPLTLILEHATRANLDQELTLNAFSPNVYPISDRTVEDIKGNKWYVKVHPSNDPQWEMVGQSDNRHSDAEPSISLTLP
ncbi:FixH family protein [Suttonella sp. R2A3]|uniref:FixH family protein n=1 Tax=Suttonella sp. R2A3 TaxID=2908648 RepID=UPI001F245779|nr:FixH family protein [Suttonella sp. R2A3]UJF23985.1 FixH family protein [Suttonella sp. R2A3]